MKKESNPQASKRPQFEFVSPPDLRKKIGDVVDVPILFNGSCVGFLTGKVGVWTDFSVAGDSEGFVTIRSKVKTDKGI